MDSVKSIFHDSPTHFMLYADDLTIYISDDAIENHQNGLQTVLNNLTQWSIKRGLEFSYEKTVVQHFCKKRFCSPLTLTLNNVNLTTSMTHKFLGLTLDKKWTWLPHIKNLKQQCKKCLNALRCLKGIHKGSNRETLLTVMRSLVISKLNYGSEFYGSAAKSYLQQLNPILNDAIRIAIGAFRTTPVISLIGETGLLPLNELRSFNAVKYIIKQKSIANSFHNTCAYPFPRTIKHRANYIFGRYGIPSNIFYHPFNRELITINNSKNIKILDRLVKFPKNNTPNELYLMEFRRLKENIRGQWYFTDGSKQNNRTGFSICTDDEIVLQSRTPDQCSIFSVEAYALFRTIKIVLQSNNQNNIICTDSLSTVNAIRNTLSKNPLVKQIQALLTSTSQSIKICWIPSHVGIPGNEMADLAAKAATDFQNISSTFFTPDDVKQVALAAIREELKNKWQTQTTTLNQIKDEPTPWITSNLADRRDSTVLCRLRLGHTNLTHIHRILRTPAPTCNKCPTNPTLTVEHILADCPAYNQQRRKHELPNSIKEQLSDDPNIVKRTLDFLKDINLYKNM